MLIYEISLDGFSAALRKGHVVGIAPRCVCMPTDDVTLPGELRGLQRRPQRVESRTSAFGYLGRIEGERELHRQFRWWRRRSGRCRFVHRSGVSSYNTETTSLTRLCRVGGSIRIHGHTRIGLRDDKRTLDLICRKFTIFEVIYPGRVLRKHSAAKAEQYWQILGRKAHANTFYFWLLISPEWEHNPKVTKNIQIDFLKLRSVGKI
jgi:hypothetical protein